MKNLLFIGFLCLASAGSTSKLAYGLDQSGNTAPGRELLEDLRALTLKCAVRPYHIDSTGKKVYGSLQSRCAEVRVTQPQTAWVYLERQTFIIQLRESRDSDGGDLDDLVVLNSRGQRVAWRHNVAAFDDVLLALAGGKEEFPEVRE